MLRIVMETLHYRHLKISFNFLQKETQKIEKKGKRKRKQKQKTLIYSLC